MSSWRVQVLVLSMNNAFYSQVPSHDTAVVVYVLYYNPRWPFIHNPNEHSCGHQAGYRSCPP